MANVVALIPARGGSKGVPKKNIKLLGDHPLIAYSIAACRLVPGISRIIVSTDSSEIADVSIKYGAEVPFIRPEIYAQDKSSDLDVFLHFLSWWKEKEGNEPGVIAHIRPTTPFRDPKILSESLQLLGKNPKASSLRSAHELSEPVEKFFRINGSGCFEGIFPNHPEPEYYNLPRQSFRPCYHPNGYVDLILPSTIRETGKLHGSSILAFATPRSTEVDNLDDFEMLEHQLKRNGSPLTPFLNQYLIETI